MTMKRLSVGLLMAVLAVGAITPVMPAFAAATGVTMSSPSTNDSINDSDQVKFTWTGNATDGKITFTRTSGTDDAGSPHEYTLSGTLLTEGAERTVNVSTLVADGTFGTLVEGAIYTVQVSTTDGESVGETNITYDKTAPVITTSGVTTSYTKGATYSATGATYKDNVLSPSTDRAIVDGGGTDAQGAVTDITGDTVDTNTAGDYTVTYEVTDKAGNKSTADVTVTVLQQELLTSSTTSHTINSGEAIQYNSLDDNKEFAITVDSGVSSTFMKLGSSTSFDFPDNSNMTITANNANTVVFIGNNTNISGTGWDGELTLPKTTSVEVDGFTTGVAVQFGDPDRKLTFSPAISIKLNGQAGERVFITEFDNTQREVTTTCDAVSAPSNTGGFACKINSGSDIIIWTETASIFSTGTWIKTGGGDSDRAWMTKPTFGKNWFNTMQLVDDGVQVNHFKATIEDNWHTDFPKQVALTGSWNVVVMKVYSDYDLLWVEYVFDVPGVGQESNAGTRIVVPIDWQTDMINDELVHVVQENPIIDPESVVAFQTETECSALLGDTLCDAYAVKFRFLEPTEHDVFAIKAVDDNRRSTVTYLNDGLDVNGDSLNSPETVLVTTSNHRGLVELTQVGDRWNNIWQTEDGYIYEMNQFGTFVLIGQPAVEERFDSGDPRTREHSSFGFLVEFEEAKARFGNQETVTHYVYDNEIKQPVMVKSVIDKSFNADDFVDESKPTFSYEFPTEDSRTKFLKEHNLYEWARGIN